jgi:hypothetical protein
MTQGQYYYRVMFQYSDDTGTFTTTTSYNYFTRTVTPVAWNFTLQGTVTYSTTSKTVSYTLLPNETVVSGNFSYSWSVADPVITHTSTTNGLYANLSSPISGWYGDIYYTDSNATYTALSIYAGAKIGNVTQAVTTISETITAIVNDGSGGGMASWSGTISNINLTLQTKIPVTESTTATNSFNSLNASFNLGSTTVLDASGVLNYLAISF